MNSHNDKFRPWVWEGEVYLDRLRTAIATEIYEEGVHRDGPDSVRASPTDYANAALRVLADPSHRLEILSGPMNLEVREGRWERTGKDEAIRFPSKPGEAIVLVVRPRSEEATDAE